VPLAADFQARDHHVGTEGETGRRREGETGNDAAGRRPVRTLLEPRQTSNDGSDMGAIAGQASSGTRQIGPGALLGHLSPSAPSLPLLPSPTLRLPV
jgi:hypothetical protein